MDRRIYWLHEANQVLFLQIKGGSNIGRYAFANLYLSYGFGAKSRMY